MLCGNPRVPELALRSVPAYQDPHNDPTKLNVPGHLLLTTRSTDSKQLIQFIDKLFKTLERCIDRGRALQINACIPEQV
jgi:hypothetical protein